MGLGIFADHFKHLLCMVPMDPSHPPGGHYEGVVLKTQVVNLGSGTRPVAGAPAPGGVGAWPLNSVRCQSKMLIFARFYNRLYPVLGQDINDIFHGFRAPANKAA